jgi:hypothetical protein
MFLSFLVIAGAPVAAQEAPPAEISPPADPVAEPPDARPKQRLRVLVLEPSASESDAETARAIASLLAVELSKIDRFDVLSNADVKRIIELEGEKQAMGCSTTSCLAELAGAMGANIVVFGELTRLGEVRSLTLNLFNSEKASSLGRVSETFTSVEELPRRLPKMAHDVLSRFARENDIELPALAESTSTTTATPEPAAPPAAAADAGMPAYVPWIVVGAGGVGAVVGSAVTVVGLIPYFGYENAKNRAQEAPSLAEYDEAVGDLETAEDDYNGYGQMSVAGGLILTGLGAAVATGGVAWALLGGGEE